MINPALYTTNFDEQRELKGMERVLFFDYSFLFIITCQKLYTIKQ